MSLISRIFRTNRRWLVYRPDVAGYYIGAGGGVRKWTAKEAKATPLTRQETDDMMDNLRDSGTMAIKVEVSA